MSIADVAIALRLKPAAAKGRIFRARAAMRIQLQGVWREDAAEKHSGWAHRDLLAPRHVPVHPVYAACPANAA